MSYSAMRISVRAWIPLQTLEVKKYVGTKISNAKKGNVENS